MTVHVRALRSGVAVSLPISEIDTIFRQMGGVLEKVAVFLASPEGQAYVLEGLVTLDNLLSIIGMFVPPVAVVANDMKIGIAILKAAQPVIIWIEHKVASEVSAHGEINVFGSLMDPIGLFQSL